jgi:hypothetical protein
MRAECTKHGLTESHSWKFIDSNAYCDRCFKPTNFRAGLLTQTSQRVYRDRLENQKELLQPYEGNKPNAEFLKEYPTYAPDYYSDKELADLGAKKLKSRKGEKFKYDK